MNSRLRIALILLILISSFSSLMAQTEPQETVTLEGMKTWRNSSVTLSDDGQWYTVLYSLIEKPADDQKSSKDSKPQSEEQEKDQIVEPPLPYGKTEQTDVLYIHSASSGQVYEIPDGSRPQFSP